MKDTDRKESERLLGAGLEYGPFRVRLAQNAADRDEIFKLRYLIFNEELGEGIPENSRTRRDTDRYDPFCDHLLIERNSQIVGTYRILPSKRAEAAGGFYSETEFHIRKLPINFAESVEVGRACILPGQRKQATLLSLFCGLQHYLNLVNAKYLFGLATLAPMSHEDAIATFEEVRKMGRYLQIPGVEPLDSMRVPVGTQLGSKPQIPALISVYLEIGAQICATPSFDPVFGAHDFLTLLKVEDISGRLHYLINRFAKRQAREETL